MENEATQQRQSKGGMKVILIFGLIGGVIVSSMLIGGTFLWNDVLSYDSAEYMGYATMLIALSTIFIGIKNYRDKQLGGVISFGKAFKIGIFIGLVASLLYVITWMTMVQISPDVLDMFSEMAKKQMESEQLTPEEMSAKIEEGKIMMEYYKNPFIMFIATFLEIFWLAALISLISAVVLKRR